MLASRTFRTVAVLAASLALVACGETSRITPTSKATPRNVPSVKPTVNPAPTTTAPAEPSESASAAPTSGAASSAPAGGNAIEAAGTKFTPQSTTVKAGTKVTWTAKAGEFHSVASGEPGKKEAKPLSAPIGFSTYSYTFTKPGTYKYFCEPHGSVGMVGEIVVT